MRKIIKIEHEDFNELVFLDAVESVRTNYSNGCWSAYFVCGHENYYTDGIECIEEVAKNLDEWFLDSFERFATDDKETTFDWSRSYTRFLYADAACLGMRTKAARAAADDSSIAKD